MENDTFSSKIAHNSDPIILTPGLPTLEYALTYLKAKAHCTLQTGSFRMAFWEKPENWACKERDISVAWSSQQPPDQ
jgi:hypothetical protein